MNHYCLGFMFDTDGDVLLIRKNKPEWMAGKLNGLGGLIEGTETPVAAMVREFKEESGIHTFEEDWRHFATMEFPLAKVVCFSGLVGALDEFSSPTAEQVNCYEPEIIRFNDALPNLSWLLPLAYASTRVSEPWSPLWIRP